MTIGTGRGEQYESGSEMILAQFGPKDKDTSPNYPTLSDKQYEDWQKSGPIGPFIIPNNRPIKPGEQFEGGNLLEKTHPQLKEFEKDYDIFQHKGFGPFYMIRPKEPKWEGVQHIDRDHDVPLLAAALDDGSGFYGIAVDRRIPHWYTNEGITYDPSQFVHEHERVEHGAMEKDPSEYETKLEPEEETKFQSWKKENAPHDSGYDYDLRGAYKSGFKPDPETGHWPDTYKKPNHPTFSDQSIYSKDRPDLAGHWNEDTYIPPGKMKNDPDINKKGMDYQEAHDKVATPHEKELVQDYAKEQGVDPEKFFKNHQNFWSKHTEQANASPPEKVHPHTYLKPYEDSNHQFTEEMKKRSQEADQKGMTHEVEKPNPVKPYVDAIKSFASGGIHDVLKQAGIETPEWMGKVSEFLKREDVQTALGMTTPFRGSYNPGVSINKIINEPGALMDFKTGRVLEKGEYLPGPWNENRPSGQIDTPGLDEWVDEQWKALIRSQTPGTYEHGVAQQVHQRQMRERLQLIQGDKKEGMMENPSQQQQGRPPGVSYKGTPSKEDPRWVAPEGSGREYTHDIRDRVKKLYEQGKTYQEIAEATGRTRNTIGGLISREGWTKHKSTRKPGTSRITQWRRRKEQEEKEGIEPSSTGRPTPSLPRLKFLEKPFEEE